MEITHVNSSLQHVESCGFLIANMGACMLVVVVVLFPTSQRTRVNFTVLKLVSHRAAPRSAATGWSAHSAGVCTVTHGGPPAESTRSRTADHSLGLRGHAPCTTVLECGYVAQTLASLGQRRHGKVRQLPCLGSRGK